MFSIATRGHSSLRLVLLAVFIANSSTFKNESLDSRDDTPGNLDDNKENIQHTGGDSSSGTTRTTPVADTIISVNYPSFAILALGDWGGSGVAPFETVPQINVAKGMAAIATNQSISSVLALGDNFYPLGICNNETFFPCNVTDWRTGTEYDPRFTETFENVYNETVLMNIPWRPIAGNHDALGNVSAELFYSNISTRWKFPNYYYTIQYSLISQGTSYVWQEVSFRPSDALLHISFLMLDVTLWWGVYSDPVHYQMGIEEWIWVNATFPLLANVSDFFFVASHYPLYSACAHGNVEYMIDNLLPLFDQYNITAYLSGHDHCQEYLTVPFPSKPEVLLPLIVSGTGDGCCYGATNIDYLAPAQIYFLQAGEPQYNPTNQTGGFISLQIDILNTTRGIEILSEKGLMMTPLTANAQVIFYGTNGTVLFTTPLMGQRTLSFVPGNDLATNDRSIHI